MLVNALSSSKLSLYSWVYANLIFFAVNWHSGRVISEDVLGLAAWSGCMNTWESCTVCKKDMSSALSLGLGQFWIISTFDGSADIPCLEYMWPNHLTWGTPNWHFSFLSVMLNWRNLSNSASSRLSCSVSIPCTTMSVLICCTPFRPSTAGTGSTHCQAIVSHPIQIREKHGSSPLQKNDLIWESYGTALVEWE